MELVYTNDKCIGCNKCIRACYCEGACIAVEQDGIHFLPICKKENLFHCWLLLLLEQIIWTNMKKS